MPIGTALRPLAPPGQAPAAPRALAEAHPTPQESPPPPAAPNPSLRLDPALGLVVLEVRDAPGDALRTIPSPQALAAYRASALSGAPLPPGVAPLPGRKRAEPPP